MTAVTRLEYQAKPLLRILDDDLLEIDEAKVINLSSLSTDYQC